MVLSRTQLHIKDLFERLLTPLWLRPERALWDAHELYAVNQFFGKKLKQPSLEYGCTEGVNTFIMLGGEFGIGFDDYDEAVWGKDSHTRSSLQDDYFSTYKSNQKASILQKPHDHFEVGVSWKESHIQKSNKLGIYKRTVLVPLNESLTEFMDGAFATIWSPNLFWSDEDKIEMLLKDQRRLLKKDGRMVTIFPDVSQERYSFFRYAEQTDTSWMKDVDRGMHVNFTRNARNFADWQGFFEECGLSVTKHGRFIPSLVSQVYNVGFRPMFPVFMNMYEKLRSHSVDDLLDLKAHWIEVAYHFLSPLCEVEWMEEMGMEKLWHIFQLRRT